MSDLKAMIERVARPGEVRWIGVRPARRADMQARAEAVITHAGLEGDHGRPGKRAVTLVQEEHLTAIGSFLGESAVSPQDLRRNLVISGVNLAGMKGRLLQVGASVLRLSVICAPCSRMEETFGHGGYAAVRGHGGWCAEVVTPGRIAIGDTVCPVDEELV